MSIRTQRSSTRIGVAALAAALIAALFAFASPAGAAANVQVKRISGATRYDTAAAAALQAFPNGSNNIVLASGENFPDGLAAAYLSGAAQAPLLLTAKNGLPAATSNTLGVLDGKVPGTATVHVVGGSAAVGAPVLAELAGLGYNVNVISGANRYETAAKIAAAANTFGGVGSFDGLKTAIVVTGENFPDALSAGALSFAGRFPILLTASSALSSETEAALTSLGIKQVFILGGEAAVSASVATSIEGKGISVKRFSGATRAGTAASLAQWLVTPTISGGAGWNPAGFVLATGGNFPDALAAAQVGGKGGPAPILLTGSLPTETQAVLTAYAPWITSLLVLGGTNAIDEATVDAAVAAAKVEVATATIKAVDGGTTITVTYSQPVVGANLSANYRVNNTAVVAVPTYDAVTRTASVTVPALKPGDVITVNPVRVVGASPDTRLLNSVGAPVPTTTLTIATDAAAPVATLLAYNGVATAYVMFDKPVTATGTPQLKIGNVSKTLAGSGILWTANFAGDLPVHGQAIELAADSFQSTATTPVKNVLTAGTVITDTAGPVLLSASYTAEATSQAFAVVGTGGSGRVTITAKEDGIADGAAGNGWSIVRDSVDAPATGNVQVAVSTNTRTITIKVPANPAVVNATELVTALQGNATFNNNFTAVVTEAGNVDKAAISIDPTTPRPLTTGTSKVSVTLQFNEALLAIPVPGNILVPGGSVNNQVINALNPSQVVFDYTIPAGTAFPTTVNVQAGSVTDLAGNGNVGSGNVAVTPAG